LERVVDLMLAANESAHNDLAEHTGATIVRVPTGDAGSLDRDMSPEVRQRLYDDGYASTMMALAVAVPCESAT
jgi:NTE family protein